MLIYLSRGQMTKQTPFGRLAQLGERPLDVRKVTGSSPVSSTKEEDKNREPSEECLHSAEGSLFLSYGAATMRSLERSEKDRIVS